MERHICEAIARRRLLMFGYGANVRLVEPYLYGRNTQGREALSAWLRPGYSRSQPQGGWRMFLVDGMRDVGLMSEEFTPRTGYNPRDPHFTEVFCRVEPGPERERGSGGAERQGDESGASVERGGSDAGAPERESYPERGRGADREGMPGTDGSTGIEGTPGSEDESGAV